MKLYAIRVVETGKFLGVDYSANDGEFCCSVGFTFCYSEHATVPLWTTDSRQYAENVVLTRNIEWYNADYSSPEFSKSLKNVELEVVEISI
jgi:hypothetical protein